MSLQKNMLRKPIALKNPLSLFILVYSLLLPLCSTAPETPYLPKNTRIFLVIESSDKKIDESMLIDTAGKTFRIGLRSNYREFVDSIRISIFSQQTNMVEKDSSFLFDTDVDTQWINFVLNVEGAKYIIAKAFIQDRFISSDSANIYILSGSSQIKNHAPKWTLDTIAISIYVGSLLSFYLRDSCIDEDGDSISLFLQPGQPSGDSIQNGSYIFIALQSDTGIFYPQIMVKDIHGAVDTTILKLSITNNIFTNPDSEPPIFTYIYGPKDNERLTAPTDSFIYKISDASGIDSVFWTLNGDYAGLLKKQLNDNFSLAFELLKFNSNRIVIYARDNSPKKIQDSVVIVINYNTKPGAVIPSTPVTKAVGVDTVPNFSWTGGDDPDGDTVFYKVIYGTSANELSQKTNEVTGKTITIPIAEKLKSYTKYYWKVIAYSKVFPDTSKSVLDSFTTTSALITISQSPSSISINEGDTLILSVIASGTPPPKNYQWYHNNAAIANATSAVYKKPNAKAIDAGQYHVIVSNEAGNEAISSTAIVKVICKFSVIYSGNGNSSGTAPATMYCTSGTVVMIAGSGDLVKTGYAFEGWNTAPEGSGKAFVAGASLTIDTVNITLYAQWAKNQYSVSYQGNGSTYGTPPPATNHYFNDQVTVAAPGSLTKTGYSFISWNTDSTGTGIDYSVGSKFTMGAVNVILYARWEKNKYKVTYNGNGNNGGSVPAEAEYDFGATVTVADNSGELKKTGYTFGGWNTQSNGNGTNYAPNAIFTMGVANITLYAKWTPIPFTVYFNSQGGSAVASILVDYGTCATEPTAPTKQSYTFAGWFKEATCSNQWIFKTDKILTNDTLFAKWIIKDIDGNVYTEVKIGAQVWMVENLKVTRYNDGNPITLITDSSKWCSTPAYCWYNNNEAAFKNSFGALYNWFSVNAGKLAPAGWHVPRYNEVMVLITYLGGDTIAGGKLKEAGTTHWASPNTGATNETGFSAIPTGCRNEGGLFTSYDSDLSIWWTSTEGEEARAFNFSLFYEYAGVWLSTSYQCAGYSVRCVRDY